MRIKSVSSCMGLAMLVALALTLTACGAQESTGPLMTETEAEKAEAEAFSCHTFDEQGEKVHGFKREADGIWYLFVPSAQSLSELVIHYTGNVTEVSGGTIDAEASTVANAFADSGDKVELTTEDGEIYTVAAMQSELPSVQIYLKDTTLDTIHLDKDEKYKENTVVLTDPDGTYSFSAEDSVEIKGRGNSTWTLYDKKGYQIKFDEKTSVLGMGEAKKWVLLANSSDDSMLRTQLVYRMAENLDMDFIPDFEYVDLWIDGEYLGTYILGEKVEIGDSRLNLKQPDGALFEHDESFYDEEEYWLYNTFLQRHFTLKEIATEEDAVIITAMQDFDEAVDKFASYLYTTPSKEVTLNDLSTMIDVDSFAKYYLINEYVLNREAFATSFYWYKDGAKDVIHLGPIWDFDTCMGNDGADFTESYGENHVLFRYLLAVPEFRERTEELYAQYEEEFVAIVDDVSDIKEQIDDSAAMNYSRWDVLGKPTPKKDAANFYDTFDEAVDAVETWLKGRESNFSIADCRVVTSKVSEDSRVMDIYFEDDKPHEKVLFAVWNPEADEDYVRWYPAEQTEGVWHYAVPLTDFGTTGMYRITAHADDVEIAIADGRNYVEYFYPMDIQWIDEREYLTITLQDLEPCEVVTFAVWSEENGQDDIQWFTATRNSEGLWEAQVDMTKYRDTGEYNVHAYEWKDNAPNMLNTMTVQVKAD